MTVQNAAAVSVTHTATTQISIHEVKDHTSDLRFVKDARDEKLRTAADNQASNERNTACIKVINAETGQTSVDTVKDCTAEVSADREFRL